MELKNKTIGFALCGSFCTFNKVIFEVEKLVDKGAVVYPIMSQNASSIDTRFGKAEDFKTKLKELTGKDVITTISAAEPIGPKSYLDALVVAPCTGNTIGKLANGITDTSVTMATKAHLRNNKPVIIAVSTNDGLGVSATNIGKLMNMKNYYFVPFSQDDAFNKNNSLVADMSLIIPTIESALDNKKLQPQIK